MKTKKIGLDAIPSVGLHLPGANHSSDPMNIIARNFDKVKQVQQPIPHADTIPSKKESCFEISQYHDR